MIHHPTTPIDDDTILKRANSRGKLDKVLQPAPQPFTDKIESDVFGVPIVCFRSAYGDNFLFNREPILTVGRETPSHNIYPSFNLGAHNGAEHGVSRKHAKIMFIDEKFHVMDLNSTNGTRINDKTIAPHQMFPVYENDKIMFATFIVYIVWIS